MIPLAKPRAGPSETAPRASHGEGRDLELWIAAIAVLLFLGLLEYGPRRVPPRAPSAKAEGSDAPTRETVARWKRNPGNRWEREREAHHPVGSPGSNGDAPARPPGRPPFACG